MKTLILLIVSICFCVFGLWASVYKKQYCGKIKYKISATRFAKYSAVADRVFVVDFPEKGIIEIYPSWNDFMTYEEGQTFCYSLFVLDITTRVVLMLTSIILVIVAVFRFLIIVVA